ncbi:MAG: hypothetical protein HUJ94_04985, partial [Bacteroidales bacterium]|nr:hypothetical protein [Bacteroidales bacterium]
DLTQAEANELLKAFAEDDLLRIKLSVRLSHATDFRLTFRGQNLVDYDLNGNRINGQFYPGKSIGSTEIEADVYVDRSMVEAYIDGGLFSYSYALDDLRPTRSDALAPENTSGPGNDPFAGRRAEGYILHGNRLHISSIEIFRARSIWR